MKCNHPNVIHRTVRNEKQRFVVPCGKCVKCMKNRRLSWFIRLREELKDSSTACFVTLTYADEYLPYNKNGLPSVNKHHIQLFIRALRDSIKPRKLKYYMAAEYGETFLRPHYHLCLFNVSEMDRKLLEKAWPIGFIHIGELSEASINYVASYHINKILAPKNAEPVFTLMSKKLGIGYIERMRKFHQGNLEKVNYQYYERKVALPRYYKEKLYSPIERKLRALKVLDEMYSKDEIEEFQKKFPGENFFRFQFDSINAEQKNFITKRHSKKL